MERQKGTQLRKSRSTGITGTHMGNVGLHVSWKLTIPKVKADAACLCRCLVPPCSALSRIVASPPPPSNLTKELLLLSHHSPLQKLHRLGRSLLWSSNHSSDSSTEISGQLTSWSLQSPISDMGLLVPGHHRDVAGTKYKISRYPAAEGPTLMPGVFCPLPFTLASPWEVHLKPVSSTETLPGHRGRIRKVPGPPGKSLPLKKAIKDLISYHLPFQLARVL